VALLSFLIIPPYKKSCSRLLQNCNKHHALNPTVFNIEFSFADVFYFVNDHDIMLLGNLSNKLLDF
jgi:hypothetical protein